MADISPPVERARYTGQVSSRHIFDRVLVPLALPPVAEPANVLRLSPEALNDCWIKARSDVQVAQMAEIACLASLTNERERASGRTLELLDLRLTRYNASRRALDDARAEETLCADAYTFAIDQEIATAMADPVEDDRPSCDVLFGQPGAL